MRSELMKELFNDMLESTELIERVESNFGRELTSEERSILLRNGEQGLLNKLGLSVEDYFTMQRAIALISAGFTGSSEKYDEELDKENYKALDLFKSLVTDLECVAESKCKTVIGNEKELGIKSNIKIPQEDDHGYSEKTDSELDELFQDSTPRETEVQLNRDLDKKYEKKFALEKVFATATECKEMGITGDTYEEDDETWKDGCNIKDDTSLKEEVPGNCEEEVPGISPKYIDKIIELLDKGGEIELDEEMLDNVVERLWNTRNNVSIKIHNNKISLR